MIGFNDYLGEPSNVDGVGIDKEELEQYDKGFDDGEKKGREDAAHEIISLLDKWGERTKAMNPDIAIGYQNAIGVIRFEYLKENNNERL